MIRRREFIAGLGGAAAWPFAARAQPVDRVPRVGMISSRNENDSQARLEEAALREGLAKAGWIDGRNVVIDYRRSAADDAGLRTTAAELVGRAPNVIVAVGTGVVAKLKQQTGIIPIVFVNVGDPVANGFVASYARPGGNITGFTTEEFSFAGKWLSLLKDIAPGLRNVTMLYDPRTAWLGFMQTLEVAAPALGVSVRGAPVAGSGEIERQIESVGREPGPGLIVMPGGETIDNRELIVALAVRYRVPAMYAFRFYATSGGLAAYGPDESLAAYGPDEIDIYRRAAQYVDRILRGERPADLPVQAPTKFEFVLNLKAAEAIGLSVPTSVQILADEVIE